MSFIQPELKMISVNQLHFDPENPRLPPNIRKAEDVAVFEWMLKKANLLELMDSISSTGYSAAEPVLVVSNPQALDQYTVVEGNRRLAAVKLLLKPHLAPLRVLSVTSISETSSDENKATFLKLPCLVYPTRDDILDYLGYRHITGIKPWGSREKAEYLKQLYLRHNNNKFDYNSHVLSKVSKMIGSNSTNAKRILSGLALLNTAEDAAFWGSDDLSSSTDIDFSVLTTALNMPSVRSFVGLKEQWDWSLDGLNYNTTKEFFEWVFGKNKKVSESRELKIFGKVLESKEALCKIREGWELADAAIYSENALDSFRAVINKVRNQLQDADRISTKVINFSDSDLDSPLECSKISRKLYNYIKDSLDIDE